MPAKVKLKQSIISICEAQIMDSMRKVQAKVLNNFSSKFNTRFLAIATFLFFLISAAPAFAHHPMGGKTPSTLLEGFLSGLAHPIIGFDHFSFVVALGLITSLKTQGIWIPFGFLLAAMVGAGLHLNNVSLPIVELIVSGSILLFGGLIVIKNSPKTPVILAIATIAGLFHGHAYAEAIFGAQITPLISYLIGFTLIQMVIAGSAYAIAKKFLNPANLRSAGFVICGVGLSFLSAQVVNLILPLPQ